MMEIIQQISVNIEIPSIFNIEAIAFHMYSGSERMIDYTVVRDGGKLTEHMNDERISTHNIIWIRLRREFYDHIIKERNTHKG